MPDFNEHIPVLRDEALESLRISANGTYVDATYGRGGHSQSLLSRLGEQGRLLALDVDPTAVECARERHRDDPRFSIVHSNFSEIRAVVEQASLLGGVDGVLFDLGVSSPQLDDAGRGFSFNKDGPLDMRMDQNRGESAADWLARVSEQDMADVFWRYGEERYSRRIARSLIRLREEARIDSTLALSEAVKSAHPRWEPNRHPATRVFQAIRIHVNRELDALNEALAGVIDVLREGGRLVVISFHSLEDRIVKQFIRGDHTRASIPRGLPVATERWCLKSVGKAVRPSAQEVNANPRARSSVLRVAERAA